MKVLYADFNDFGGDGNLLLTCAGAVRSISELDQPLEDGQEVVLSDGECWVIARVRRREDGTWEAHGEWHFESHGEHDK